VVEARCGEQILLQLHRHPAWLHQICVIDGDIVGLRDAADGERGTGAPVRVAPEEGHGAEADVHAQAMHAAACALPTLRELQSERDEGVLSKMPARIKDQRRALEQRAVSVSLPVEE
jgi:hypothetical protein